MGVRQLPWDLIGLRERRKVRCIWLKRFEVRSDLQTKIRQAWWLAREKKAFILILWSVSLQSNQRLEVMKLMVVQWIWNELKTNELDVYGDWRLFQALSFHFSVKNKRIVIADACFGLGFFMISSSRQSILLSFVANVLVFQKNERVAEPWQKAKDFQPLSNVAHVNQKFYLLESIHRLISSAKLN